jgi:hypothetical protein
MKMMAVYLGLDCQQLTASGARYVQFVVMVLEFGRIIERWHAQRVGSMGSVAHLNSDAISLYEKRQFS